MTNRRPTSQERGYDYAFQKLRRQLLSESPSCQCGASATEVDHVVPMSKGGLTERSNLVTICRPCHARKTMYQDRGFAPRLGPSNWDRRPNRLRFCGVCGRSLTPKQRNSRQRYCSRSCYYETTGGADIKPTTCDYCGRAFKPHGNDRGQFCSVACSGFSRKQGGGAKIPAE